MIDDELEQRLRAWYRAEIGEGEMAPATLRSNLAAIPRTALPRRFGGSGPVTLLAAAALLVVGGAIAAGSGLVRIPSVPPAVTSDTSRSPREQSSPTPETSSRTSVSVLGGGLILVRDAPRDAKGGPIDTVHGFPTGTYGIFAVDAGSGARTLLGTVPYDWKTGYQPEVHWAPDRKHVLVTDPRGKVWPLDAATAAGKQLALACCAQPDVVGWVFSPGNDRMAGLNRPTVNVPGQQGTTPVTDAIVISNLDGTGVHSLPLPKGADSGAAGEALSWAPDGSAVVIAGCRPCNYAGPGKTPTDVTHSHLFIVPLDGTPVQELLDETGEGLFNPSWSPDGLSIVVGRNDCQPKEVQPYCFTGRLSVAVVRAIDGRQTVLADAPQIFSGPFLSPDGRRIAFGTVNNAVTNDKGRVFVMDADGSHLVRLGDGFVPRWSPDGTWLLYSDVSGAVWIMKTDGSDPRLIGTYGSAAW